MGLPETAIRAMKIRTAAMAGDRLTLTADEVFEITGSQWRRKQLEYFVSIGVPAHLNNCRKVVVNRDAYYAKTMPAGPRSKAKTEPRLDLLKHG